jgi:hypothetical protein
MEAARWLVIQDLGQPLVPKDDVAFLLFFDKLIEKLIEAVGRLMEVIDAEC